MAAEVTVAVVVVVTEMVDLAEAVRSASSVINLDTLHVNAKRIRTSAIVATVLDTSRKTVSRFVTNEIK